MEWVARVGIDWADEKHDWVLKDEGGRREGGVFRSSPEAIHEWVRNLRTLYPSGKILVTGYEDIAAPRLGTSGYGTETVL